jgi:hypothetical protein
MARAAKNTLHKSRIEMDRQQRQEQPDVPGASGASDDASPEAAQVKGRKRAGRRSGGQAVSR